LNYFEIKNKMRRTSDEFGYLIFIDKRNDERCSAITL
jgi:hypothetical protein